MREGLGGQIWAEENRSTGGNGRHYQFLFSENVLFSAFYLPPSPSISLSLSQ